MSNAVWKIKGTVNGITVYDDFAHHPTAIETTIEVCANVSVTHASSPSSSLVLTL